MTLVAVWLDVKSTLEELLGSVTAHHNGVFATHGSTGIYVEAGEYGPSTIVKISSPLVRNVPVTGDVYRWVAKEGQAKVLGHARLEEDSNNPGTGMILWEDELLLDASNPDAVRTMLTAILVDADELDDELQRMFGGVRWSDDH